MPFRRKAQLTLAPLDIREFCFSLSVFGCLIVCGCTTKVMDEKQRPEKRPQCSTFMAHLCCCAQEATDMDRIV